MKLAIHLADCLSAKSSGGQICEGGGLAGQQRALICEGG